MKNFFIVLIIFVFSFQLFSADTTGDNFNKIEDVLNYGIESEVTSILRELGNNPKMDLYPKLVLRYQEARTNETKVNFVDFFANCNNLPDNVLDVLYNDASSDNLDKRYMSSLFNCLGKKGKVREGELLLSQLDKDDILIKNITTDAISKMKVPEMAKSLLTRLEESDTKEDKYLSPDIKGRLIVFFGENKSNEAITYLRKIISDKASDKFMIMNGMVSLLKIGDVDSIDIINQNLSNPELKIQEYAGYSISQFKNPKAVPILRKMLLHNNETVRYYACQGIFLNEDIESMPVLIYKYKNDPSKKVQQEALFTLVYFGINGIDKIKQIMKGKKYSQDQLNIISIAVSKKPREDTVNYLLELYNSAEKKDKEIIARNIINATSNKVDPIIKLLLSSEDYQIRIGGIKAVYQIENSSLWNIVEDISKNDKVEIVKVNAKKYLNLKK
jgi:HEAT repeat protein